LCSSPSASPSGPWSALPAPARPWLATWRSEPMSFRRRSRVRVRSWCLSTLPLALAFVGPSEVHAGRRGTAKAAEAAAQTQLALTRSASDLRQGLAAIEREAESLRYALRLLDHRKDESLRRLKSYRAARGAREDQARVRARALYKLA